MSAAVYTIRRQVFTLFGAKFQIFNAAGEQIGFCKQKAFKLKEDIRIFTDDTLSRERVSIQAQSVVDFSAAYDVLDSQKQERVGTLQRRGLASLLRDSWIMFDADGVEVGKIEEDSMLLALVRRFASNLIPQHFHLRDASGSELASFRAHFNPFVSKMTVTVHEDYPANPLLVLAAGILLVAIEGRQG